LLLSAATVVVPVRNEDVWHNAQPMAENRLRPRPIDAEPPGELVDGVGGARKRMKNANFSMALTVSVGSGPSTFVTSFGCEANWQLAFSSRSTWNSSFEMPISTLYASPENSSSDSFCAFQPKRETVPSLPLRLRRPLMPNDALVFGLALTLLISVWSGIISIRPAPNVGVGMRKMTLLRATCVAKSSWAAVQPLASPLLSTRPRIVNNACTPPSRLPSGLVLKRASRTGRST
jgi:hypothetical protein